ncbi:MAG: hypothetical protein KDA33_03985 [Phycisphaerales bacterium]|nr:hypothetical protein [Phycisphaerales bacterium]
MVSRNATFFLAFSEKSAVRVAQVQCEGEWRWERCHINMVNGLATDGVDTYSRRRKKKGKRLSTLA